MPLAIAPLLIIDAYIISSSTTQQNDIDQASLCVYLCSKYGVPAQKKINFVLIFWCVYNVFGCALYVYHLRSQIYILGSCVFILSIRCYRTHGQLNMVLNQHIVNTTICLTHPSTNLLGCDHFLSQATWI